VGQEHSQDGALAGRQGVLEGRSCGNGGSRRRAVGTAAASRSPELPGRSLDGETIPVGEGVGIPAPADQFGARGLRGQIAKVRDSGRPHGLLLVWFGLDPAAVMRGAPSWKQRAVRAAILSRGGSKAYPREPERPGAARRFWGVEP
jgi:hypothetical protein